MKEDFSHEASLTRSRLQRETQDFALDFLVWLDCILGIVNSNGPVAFV